MQAAGRGKASMVRPSYGPHKLIITSLAGYTQWDKSGMTIVGVTTCLLTGFAVCSTGESSCMVCRSGQELMSGEVIDSSKREPTAVVLLHGLLSNRLLNIYVYTDRFLLLSAFVTEAPFRNGQQFTQRLITGQSPKYM